VHADPAGPGRVRRRRPGGRGRPAPAPRQAGRGRPAAGAAADRRDALFAINDRADIALAAGADVLHLGQDDLPLTWARRILGEDVLLGRSTHDLAQATKAAAEPWDYLVAGPVWATATKPGRPATGTALVEAVAALDPPQPWFAIGGITPGNLPEVTAAGATRIVVVRAITDAPDPATATRTLRDRLTGG
jgi:thiamine-phosphate pyrophosphorylase